MHLNVLGAMRRFTAAVALTVAACGGGGGGTALPVTIALTASADTPAQVSLTWSAPVDQTQFDVFRGGVALFGTHIGGYSVTEYTLEPDTRYCYHLSAVQFPLGAVGTSNTACITTPPTSRWPVAVIERDPAQSPSLATDDRGVSHVSFRSGDSLVYLTNASGSWVSTLVDGAAGGVGRTAIAVDASHAVHISYYRATQGALAYATNRSGAWSTATVAPAGGYHNAIALDNDAQPHIAYSGDPTLGAALMHASLVSNTWALEFVTPGAVMDVSVANASGSLHLGAAIGDGVNCAVVHAVSSAGAWDETLVSPSAACSMALAVDGTGSVHMAYMTHAPGFALQHASNRSGAWMVEQIDDFYWIPGDALSIAADAAGRAYISYTDHSGLLKYATDAGGAWHKLWLDTHAFDNVISLGSDGRARIVYVASDAGGTAKVLRFTTSP